LELSLAFTIEGTEKHRGKKAQREGLEIPRCARTQSKNINHKGHEGTQRLCWNFHLLLPQRAQGNTEETAQSEGWRFLAVLGRKGKNINHKGHEGTQSFCLVALFLPQRAQRKHRGKKTRAKVGVNVRS
jgi:hypothetical protein